MKNYSFRKNLNCMAIVFYKPKLLIDIFSREISLLYSVVPLVMFTTLFEVASILDYIFEAPAFFHLLGWILNIPDAQYNFYQIFLLPVVHIGDFFIFGGLIFAVSRLMQLHKVDTVKTVFFFMFIFNTVGLLGFITETLYFKAKIQFLFYANPIYFMIYLLYVMEFIHKQAEISRRKSLVLSIVGAIVFLSFRMIFLG